MYTDYQKHLETELRQIQAEGLWKKEHKITSPQITNMRISGREVLNFCSNNYLGLANYWKTTKAAAKGIEAYGYGMASVRFICGTQTIHLKLEKEISDFFGTEDTILYGSCFDANGGLFETLLDERDAVISDALNHASIIDGIRLCKAKRFRYANADMSDLEEQIKAASGCRFRLIATDAVFSMDGNAAPLDEIYRLAERYNAMIMVDESHSAGVLGKTGTGLTEVYKLKGKIEIITGTLGKALGGASGGFTTGKKEIIDLLRQRSRPYLFSNSLPPAVVAGSLKALEVIRNEDKHINNLHKNIAYFLVNIRNAGFDIKPSRSAICAVMIYDATLAHKMAEELLSEGIYVTAFCYPVVPKGEARIRIQISAQHSRSEMMTCIRALVRAGRKFKLLKSPEEN
ncbi:MAG: glycine C-acetyltransferase [Dysgonamonadaceae bacterium]|jgi:glycine C-acetyltransferase|nr:glycine C-acetyltransferase [Dysgonamonadaceae bacterium]